MHVMDDQVADYGCGEKAREREDVGEGVDVFVGGEEGGERGRPVDWVNRE